MSFGKTQKKDLFKDIDKLFNFPQNFSKKIKVIFSTVDLVNIKAWMPR